MSQLAPAPKFSATYVNAAGYTVPAVGYKLYSYLAGTSTPKVTYTSGALSAANANPTILDARGEASVWLDGNYKFILKTDADVTVWTVDHVNDFTSGVTLDAATFTGALTISSTAVTWSGNPTHSGNHTFSGNVSINGNSVIGDASTDTLTIAPAAVTWSGNPTHSGNHTFSGSVAGGHSWTSFTPGVSFGGATVGITYNINRAGIYAKVGDIVLFHLRMRLSNKGSSVGSAVITGLPVASVSSSNMVQYVCYVDASSLTGLTGSVMGTVLGPGTTIALSQWGAAGTTVITDTSFTNASDIYVSGFYPWV